MAIALPHDLHAIASIMAATSITQRGEETDGSGNPVIRYLLKMPTFAPTIDVWDGDELLRASHYISLYYCVPDDPHHPDSILEISWASEATGEGHLSAYRNNDRLTANPSWNDDVTGLWRELTAGIAT